MNWEVFLCQTCLAKGLTDCAFFLAAQEIAENDSLSPEKKHDEIFRLRREKYAGCLYKDSVDPDYSGKERL